MISSRNSFIRIKKVIYILGIICTKTIIIGSTTGITDQIFVNGFLHPTITPAKKSSSSSYVMGKGISMNYYYKRNEDNILIKTSTRKNDCNPSRPTKLEQQRSSINRSDNEKNRILKPKKDIVRRQLLSMIVSSSIVMEGLVSSPTPGNAFIIDQQATQRRQLELCLVTLFRVLYWVLYTIDEFKKQNDQQKLKSLYLETRLGAKALLTGKLGDGSTAKVYALSKFKIPGCLSDLEWYITNSQVIGVDNKKNVQRIVSNAKTTFYEGLANLVEFDGFDTLYDPSPRASLTVQQYTTAKCQYVQRILSETILPAGIQLVTSFGPEPLKIAENYIDLYYKNEIYTLPPPTVVTTPPPSPNTSLPKVSDTVSSETSNDDVDYDGSY